MLCLPTPNYSYKKQSKKPNRFCHYSDKELSSCKSVSKKHVQDTTRTQYWCNIIWLDAECMSVDQSYRGQWFDLIKSNTDAWFCPACVTFDENSLHFIISYISILIGNECLKPVKQIRLIQCTSRRSSKLWNVIACTLERWGQAYGNPQAISSCKGSVAQGYEW